MKLFGLHPYKPTPTYIFLEGGKQILTPTQTIPLPLLHFFYGIFWGGGKVRLGGDELIKLEKILYNSPYNSPYLHTCPQPSSTFLLKVGGFNLKCRLTDQIPTLTLRNSHPPPSNFRGDGTFLCYSIAPTWGPLLPSQRSIYIQCWPGLHTVEAGQIKCKVLNMLLHATALATS